MSAGDKTREVIFRNCHFGNRNVDQLSGVLGPINDLKLSNYAKSPMVARQKIILSQALI